MNARTRLVWPCAARGALATAVLALVLAGCAVTPPKPPDCEGPWTPINAARTEPRP